MSFANLRISAKFPLVIVAVSLLTGLATGITAHTRFSTQLERFAKEQLVALRESRQASLETYLDSIRQDLDMLASSLLVEKAMVNFTGAWYEIGDDPGGQLRKLYIDDNPNPAGKKADLYNARDGSKYSIRHGFYHRWFRKFQDDRGYYDIFLFTPASDLIYTVQKEADYATNFEVGGPWADTDLGTVFRAVNDNPTPGIQVFTDFEAYGPSNDAPASFIAQPVFDGGGTYLGVLGIQIPIGRINQVMQVSAGLGETGEAYMVGADLLMRSDSQFSAGTTILETKVDTQPARKALAGEVGVEVVPEYRGMAMVSAFGPLEFMGVRWAVIAEIGRAELLAPVAETGTFMIAAVAGITVMVALFGTAVANGLSRPIVEMTQTMRRLAAGDLEVEIGSTDRGDEIGEMAAALDVFKENAVRRQKAEEEARESGAQLRAFIDNSPAAISLKDTTGRFTVINHRYEDMIGTSSEEARGKTSIELFPEGFAESGIAHDRAVLESDEVSEREEKIVEKGAMLTLLTVKFPMHDADGKIAAIGSISTDITELKRAEAALKESEALFEQAARMTHVGHWAYDETSNELTHCSEEIARFFGLTVEEYIAGFSIDVAEMALVHPDDRDEFGALIADAHANAKGYDTVFRDLPPDGKVRYIHEVGQPIFDDAGSFVRMIGSAQDITEQKQIEASLAETGAVFEQAARMAHLGHWVFDETLGRLTTCSEEVARIHGLSVEDYLAGFTISDPEMELVHPDDRAEFIDLIVDVHANAKSYDTVYRSLRPDGAVRHVREVGQPIFDDAGAFVRMIGSAQDITEQKQAEAALKESEALFEQAGRMAHLGHWAYDEVEQRVTHCSEETARIHGLTVKEYMVSFSVGDAELMLVHPDDRQDLDDLLQDAQQNATGYDAEYRIVLPDGGVRHIREVGDPVFDESGNLVRTIGMVQDITERKTWEEELARKEAQLRVTMDNMPGGMFMADDDLVVQVYNEQYREMYELPDGAVREGGPLSDVVRARAERGDYGPGDPETLIEQRMKGYIERMALQHEEELPNGRVIELSRRPIEGGGVVGIATDITERKRAERELLFAQFSVENSSHFVIWVNLDGSINYVNRTACENLGYTRDELVGMKIWKIDVDFSEEKMGQLVEATDEQESMNIPATLQAKDGRLINVEVFISRARYGDKDIMIANATDITERIKAERVLAEKEAQLRIALDNMPGGMRLIDKDLNYVLVNSRYSELYNFPEGLLKAGESVRVENLYQAQRGDFGPGDPETLTDESFVGWTGPTEPMSWETTTVGGKIIQVDTSPTPDGGVVNVATDITERKKAEQELAEKEAQLRLALDNMPGGIKVVDADLNYVLINPQYSELYDFPDGLLQVGGSMRIELSHQADRGDFGPGELGEKVEEVVAFYQRREAGSYERETATGRVLETSMVPTQEGQYVTIVTDITERKRAEQAVRESEALLKTVLDNMPAVAFLKSLDGQFRLINRKYEELYGVTFDAVRGKTLYDLHPKERADDYTRFDRETIEAEDVAEREIMVEQDGEERFLTSVMFPVFDQHGTMTAFGGIEVDITDRKRMEGAINEQKAVVDAVLANMDQGVIMYDADFKVRVHNEQARRLWDFPEEVLYRGASFEEIDRYLAARGDLGSKQVEQQLEARSEQAMSMEAHTLERTLASGRVLEIRRQPVPDGGVVATQTDITERKRAENELAEAHELITSSIDYASRIQRSALPPDDLMTEVLAEHFVIWEPRDVVGGDIYWARRVDGGHIVAVADCTGHGVPGAFLTMIATGALRQAIIEHPDGDPAKVIGRMNSFIKNSLRQDTAEGPSDDGLELGICRIDEGGERLTFAGARFSLWKLDVQGAEEIKGDKSGIGYHHVPSDRAFTNHEVPLTPDAAYYLFSDGLVDQVGGEKRRAFGKKRIIALLDEHLGRPLAEQRDAVMAAFTAYQGNEIRRDDVTFLGFRMHS